MAIPANNADDTADATTLYCAAVQALEELKKQADRNILLYCLYAMVQFLLETLQLVTKFATVSSEGTQACLVMRGCHFWQCTSLSV